MQARVRYQSHNGGNINADDVMTYIPRVGELIENMSLRTSGCTGIFVIWDVVHERCKDGSFECLVKCIEIGDDDARRERLQEAGHL